MRRTALVTGANRGLGLALSKKLIARAYRVIALCRKTSLELSSLDLEIVEGIDFSYPFHVSMLNGLSIEHIDLLIHNAAVGLEDNWEDVDYEMVKKHFVINTLGPLNVSKALMPYLKRQSKVILISSRMGSITKNQEGGSYSYRLSKAALNMFGKNLALDLRPKGIIVGVISPGQMDTDMLRNVGNHGGRDVSEAASIVLDTIEHLTLEESGSYIHINNEPLPW